MPAPLGSPFFYGTDAGGLPLSGGSLYAYIAGTTTPQDTFTDATLATANANPVVLDSSGHAAVWCPDGTSYKFVLKDSGGTTMRTIDDHSPANGYPSPYPGQFTAETNPVAYASATTFKVTGINVTGTYTVGRIIQSTNTGGTVYSQVVSSSFSTDTTVTVDNFSGTLDAGLSAVNYGAVSSVNGALPVKNGNKSLVFVTGSGTAQSTTVDSILGDSTHTGTVVVDTLSEFSTSTGKFVPKVSGLYLVQANVGFTVSGVTFTSTATKLCKGGSAGTGGTFNHAAPSGASSTLTAGGSGSYVYSLTAGSGSDYITVVGNCGYSGGTPTATWSFRIERVG